MAERTWSDAQLHAGHLMFLMVQTVGHCSSMHPFSALTAFVTCVGDFSERLSIEGSHRLFAENLCHKMGYNYGRILIGLDEEKCRE